MQLHTRIILGMLVGVVLGLFLGPNSSVLPANGVILTPDARVYSSPDSSQPMALAAGLEQARLLNPDAGEGEWLQISFKLSRTTLLKLRSLGEARELKPGAEVRGWVLETLPQVRRVAPLGETFISLTEWLGRLFLALIKMVVVPLVFCSLVVGVASLGDVRRLGRLGGRTLGIFMATTVVSLIIGVGLANLARPGHAVSPEDRAVLLASYAQDADQKVEDASRSPSFVDQVISVVPENPLEALARGRMLQVIFFAMALGLALTMLEASRRDPVLTFFDSINHAMVVLVHLAMKLAPYGVAALLFKVVGTTGLTVLLALAAYSLVVLLGLALHLILVYGSLARFAAGMGFRRFLKGIRPAQLLAFSTASSSAALPVTKECVEDNLGISPEVSSFVLPLGATVNMDGTALYQGVATLFIAQIYNMDLSLSQQVAVVLTATLASVGAAGVPGAGMVTLVMVLTEVGIPAQGLALILGVDRILDMFRSAVNVTGDAAVTAVMARFDRRNPGTPTA